jgi:hypothetical protein
MVSVYALLCAASVMHSDCTNDTAIDVIRLPDDYSELACLRDSEIVLAGLAIQPQNGEYWKVICSPISSGLSDPDSTDSAAPTSVQ